MKRQTTTQIQKETMPPQMRGILPHAAVRTNPDHEMPSNISAETRFGHDFSQVAVRPSAPIIGQDYSNASCPITQQITPLIQRQKEEPEEEEEKEPVQTKLMVQRQAEEEEEEEEENIQRKHVASTTTQLIQRQIENEEDEEEPVQAQLIQRQETEEEVEPVQFTPSETPTQLQYNADETENRTGGMPGSLRSGLETLSGMDLSGVRVHNNSTKPSQLNALAYTKGRDIHLGPGQEKHLAHEGWHAVQQMQGRVKPTLQAKGVKINDDKWLEREADVMGAKALQMTRAEQTTARSAHQGSKSLQRKGRGGIIQLRRLTKKEKRQIREEVEQSAQEVLANLRARLENLSAAERAELDKNSARIRKKARKARDALKGDEFTDERTIFLRGVESAWSYSLFAFLQKLLVEAGRGDFKTIGPKGERKFTAEEMIDELQNRPEHITEHYAASLKQHGLSMMYPKQRIISSLERELLTPILKKEDATQEDFFGKGKDEDESASLGSPFSDEGKGKGGEGARDFEGKSSRKRKNFTPKKKKMRRKLPAELRNSPDADGQTNLLDQIALMPDEKQERFLDFLHKEREGDTGETIDVSRLVDEFEVLEDIEAMGGASGEKMTPEKMKELRELFNKLSSEDRKAYVEFINEMRTTGQTTGYSPRKSYEKFKALSTADRDKLKLNKLLKEEVTAEGEKPKEPSEGEWEEIRTKIKKGMETEDLSSKRVETMNKNIADIQRALSELDDPKVIGDFKPLDMDSFRVLPEMIMLQGLIIGAGERFPEMKEGGQEFMKSLWRLQEWLLSQIRGMTLELGAHAVLTAIPFVGWAKALVTTGRIYRLVQRLNKLRKVLKTVKRAYNAYQSLKGAIDRARGVIGKASEFARKFEEARRNWEKLRKRIEDFEAPDDVDELVEMAFNELMEQMQVRLEALEPFFEQMYLPQEVRDDPEKLVRVLFGIPNGLDAFDEMLDLYKEGTDAGRDNDPEFLDHLMTRSQTAGFWLYPVVGFLVGKITDIIGNLEDYKFNPGKFAQRALESRGRGRERKKKGKKSRAGGLFSKLWPNRYTYKNGRKNNPDFNKAFAIGFKRLQEELPSNPPKGRWWLGTRLMARLKLRQVVKEINANRGTAPARPRGKKNEGLPWRQVPIPPFKYRAKWARKSKYHVITLKLNPDKEHKINAFDEEELKGTGIPLPDMREKHGKSIKRWLRDNDYELTKLPDPIGWHVRRPGGKLQKKRQPYLMISNDKHLKKGLSGADQGIVDKFVKKSQGSDWKILNSEQLPEGFYLRRTSAGTRAEKMGLWTKKKVGAKVKPLHLDEQGKLQHGKSKKRYPPIKLADPKDAIKAPTLQEPVDLNKVEATAEKKRKGTGRRVRTEWKRLIAKDNSVAKRPKEAKGNVGYTINAPRKSLASIKLPERRNKDDKGHIIAARFNGVDIAQNLVPMARTVNQSPGKWYKAEDALAKAFKRRLAKQQEDGHKKPVVPHVDLELKYKDDNFGRRPDSLIFAWKVKEGSSVVEKDKVTAENK